MCAIRHHGLSIEGENGVLPFYGWFDDINTSHCFRLLLASFPNDLITNDFLSARGFNGRPGIGNCVRVYGRRSLCLRRSWGREVDLRRTMLALFSFR